MNSFELTFFIANAEQLSKSKTAHKKRSPVQWTGDHFDHNGNIN
jgi:hypothetical protein